MPTFRLVPKEPTIDQADWKSTNHRSACWVQADSEDAARFSVALQTMRLPDYLSTTLAPVSPWQDANLSECTVGDPPFVVEGFAVFDDDGAVLLI